MTSHTGSRLSPTSWGLFDRRRRPAAALLDGTLLLALWMALWTVFLLGVVEPAARLGGAARPAPVEGSRT